MNNERKSNLYKMFIPGFEAFKTAQVLKNPNLKIDNNFIINICSILAKMYQVDLSDDELQYVVNLIKTNCSIFQDEGGSIVGDYEHDFNWFENLLNEENYEEYYWNRYKQYLINNKHFSPNIVYDTLEKKTLTKLMSYIGNPKDESSYSIRGLVVGDIQSGKTSNYLGLICRAADAGYKVIILLTGTIESLRRQTQIRVEEGFVGYDSVNAQDVGVQRGEITPKMFTSRKKDFTGNDDQTTTTKISSYSKEPMIFVIKKNVTVLSKLYSSLKNINTDQHHRCIDVPMIMIDDEADNASINTNKPENDPTKINNYIRKILSLFSKNNYIGFTATPFANVFINYDSNDEMLEDDLFPRNFIYSLESPSHYCGSKKYFFLPNNNIKFINDYNENIFPMNHKKDWNKSIFFDSMFEAINSFLISNAIRDVRDDNKNTHRSMLINVSRFTNVQMVIKNIVEEYFYKVLKSVRQNYRLSKECYLKNDVICSLYKTYYDDFENNLNFYVSWDQVFENLYNSIKHIEICVVNSSKNSTKLDYESHKDTGLRVIAIGGLALSRGLTLEGLCTSYFYRNTAVFDVLMQMGRWFGYRVGYEDLCRIYMTKTSFDYYKEISLSIEQLKSDIKRMGDNNLKPEDYGIRVRNNSEDLGITAPNKMRNTKSKVDRKSFYGNVFETPYISRNLKIVNDNIKLTMEFLHDLNGKYTRNKNTNRYYWEDVESSKIFYFLKSLNIDITNSNFDVNQICNFLVHISSLMNKFDVLIMTGQGETINVVDDININLVNRNFDIIFNDTLIRMSKTKSILRGRNDTAVGLSKIKIDEIEEIWGRACPSNDYMIEGRNPILIIYFINPEYGSIEYDENYFTSVCDPVKEVQLKKDLFYNKYNFLVGYLIGFPKVKGNFGDNTVYTVNKTCNYYDKKHDEDYEMYGEE